jgi:hypothetical protein
MTRNEEITCRKRLSVRKERSQQRFLMTLGLKNLKKASKEISPLTHEVPVFFPKSGMGYRAIGTYGLSSNCPAHQVGGTIFPWGNRKLTVCSKLFKSANLYALEFIT